MPQFYSDAVLPDPRAAGRERVYRFNAQPLSGAQDWIQDRTGRWVRALGRLRNLLDAGPRAIGREGGRSGSPPRDECAARAQHTSARDPAAAAVRHRLVLFIDATSAVGRLLGFAMEAPGAVGVFDELIDAGTGLELVECGAAELTNDATLVGIVRNGVRLPPEAVEPSLVQPGDRLVIVRESAG